MIVIAIREQAEKRGITTAYQLQKATGVQPTVAARWFRNDLKMIGIDSLSRLCAVLKCKPNDLLKYEPDADE
ncbi:MAG TPA: helix-turn-helix transcriptional regulator [Pyrinomonadaceae bacterium]|nr:helix-turn-helix transcriptional regulator [Pyrinomonadaceae bacterium]